MKNEIFLHCVHWVDSGLYECLKTFSTAMHKTALGKFWGKSGHSL